MSNMTDFNNQSIYESNSYSIPLDQMRSADTDYVGVLPSNQIPILNSNYANANSMDFNDACFYQSLSQDFRPSDIGPLDSNGIYMDVNESLSAERHEYVENNENRINDASMDYYSNSDIEPSVRYLLPQTPDQAQSAAIFSNNAATSHRQVIIIMNADINLERLLSIIQQCGSVDRVYM
ncbi:10765_t:CDS:1 [Paraglomus occultum]|uniref:10765_t:CDS:1 n=1 Tax=Paraglomus occultum TaxID=144539 RepID=A0A9N8ZW56_9GLOM|nr:10765_t:CDS:1 [Paraglomus occultum]